MPTYRLLPPALGGESITPSIFTDLGRSLSTYGFRAYATSQDDRADDIPFDLVTLTPVGPYLRTAHRGTYSTNYGDHTLFVWNHFQRVFNSVFPLDTLDVPILRSVLLLG
jgi:hypothetical protein